MAMNKYMHPRNIYKSPPNFKQLAINYPEFRKHVKQDLTGKVTIDFKDANALRALSCTLLKKDFGLDVTIPENKLIPTIPLRLNYLLWIEDLLSIDGGTDRKVGIDIGTGAACIYPLIAAKKYNISMLATEINDDSIKSAEENIRRNGLDELIRIVKVKENTLLVDVVQSSDVIFDFCMCNPPFFSSSQELHPSFKSRSINRPRPKNAFCVSLNEVVSHGGEVEFITKMINESKELGEKVRIYTTMIGHKSSTAPLKKLLRELNVVSFKQTEFCQGHTTRWGLAWTFSNIDLRKVPEATVMASKKEKNKGPLHFDVSLTDKIITIDKISTEIINILDTLKIFYREERQNKNVITYTIKAHSNTWSHQRRKKREQIRNQQKNETEASLFSYDTDKSCDNSLSPICPEYENAVNLFTELEVDGSVKRQMEDSEVTEYYQAKKMKSEDQSACNEEVYLEAIISLKVCTGSFNINMLWLSGNGGKEALHQILQFFKNNLKI